MPISNHLPKIINPVAWRRGSSGESVKKDPVLDIQAAFEDMERQLAKPEKFSHVPPAVEVPPKNYLELFKIKLGSWGARLQDSIYFALSPKKSNK